MRVSIILRIVAVVLPIHFAANAARAYVRLSVMRIYVYEKGVMGRGESQEITSTTDGVKAKKTKKTSQAEFLLTYDQISSVDIIDKSISIITPDTRYITYISNPAEIADVIKTQMNSYNA